MTKIEAEAMENAIAAAAASVVSGALAVLGRSDRDNPDDWAIATIRERVRAALAPAIGDVGQGNGNGGA